MKKAWIVAAFGVVLCLAVAVAFTVSVVKSAYFGRDVAKTRPRAMAAGVDRASGEPAPEPMRRRLLRQPPAPAGEPEASGEVERGAKTPSNEESEGVTSAEYHAFVNAAFESQATDPAWARDAAFEITQSVVPLLENDASKATRVECRRDLCRFEVRNRDESAYLATLEKVVHQRAWNSGWMVNRSPTDPTTMVVILAKKGEPIPGPM